MDGKINLTQFKLMVNAVLDTLNTFDADDRFVALNYLLSAINFNIYDYSKRNETRENFRSAADSRFDLNSQSREKLSLTNLDSTSLNAKPSLSQILPSNFVVSRFNSISEGNLPATINKSLKKLRNGYFNTRLIHCSRSESSFFKINANSIVIKKLLDKSAGKFLKNELLLYRLKSENSLLRNFFLCRGNEIVNISITQKPKNPSTIDELKCVPSIMPSEQNTDNVLEEYTNNSEIVAATDDILGSYLDEFVDSNDSYYNYDTIDGNDSQIVYNENVKAKTRKNKLKMNKKLNQLKKNFITDSTTDEVNEKLKTLLKCHHCPKTYTSKFTMFKHYKNHPGYCHECGEPHGNTAKEIGDHNREFHGNEFIFICDLCGHGFKRNQHYQRHLQQHQCNLNESKYSCAVCNEGFHKKRFYLQHLKESGHANTTCNLCNISFKSPKQLTQHQYRIHKKKVNHICPFCTQSFSLKCSLDRHIYLHTEVKKNFVCDQCGSTYFTETALKEHFDYMHKPKVDHFCEKCNKGFKNPLALNRHMISHSERRPYICKICTQAFKRCTHLARHKLLVHAIKPQPRQIKRFRLNGELQTIPEEDENRSQPSTATNDNKLQLMKINDVPKPKKQDHLKLAALPPIIPSNHQVSGDTVLMSTSAISRSPCTVTTNRSMYTNTTSSVNVNTQIHQHVNEYTFPPQSNCCSQNFVQNPQSGNFYPIPSVNSISAYPQSNRRLEQINRNIGNQINTCQQPNLSHNSVTNLKHNNDLNNLGWQTQSSNISDSYQYNSNFCNVEYKNQIDFNKPELSATDLLQYQNMWPQDEFTYEKQYPSNNTYNNIGNILTNLELMGSNSNFDASNFDIIPSYNDMPCNSQHKQIDPNTLIDNSVPYYSNCNYQSTNSTEYYVIQNIETNSQNIIQNYDFNSQGHTITDISHTMLDHNVQYRIDDDY